uniref:Xylulose kinase-1 n=1 Tax=Tanacetum cinerariifolium TaxID=118510 RepID=A0A699J2B2_TANCI|nr:hypothetical protein [Tanacetum cinerariifolium]
MATLQFADTHNMVTFLSKTIKSDGFEQIVDFLNAHPIRYALTVNPTIYISYIKQFWSTAMTKPINGEAQLHAKVDGKTIIVTESSVRRDLRLADEEDEVVHKELGDRLVRAATTASSIEAEHDIGNITKTQSKETPNEPSSQGTNSGGGLKCQETIGDNIAQTRVERVSKQSNDLLLTRGNTLQSDKDRVKLDELMALCTNLQNREKGKGIMIEEPMKPKKKDQIRLDEEAAKKLQAEFDEEERANIALIKNGMIFKQRLMLLIREELVQEITKKQKVKDDKEKAELKQLMESILDEEEVAIDAIPLVVKSPRIVD